MIIALDVELVPSQTPLEPVEERLAEQKIPREGSALARVVQQGADLGVPVRPLRRAAHAEASGVLGVTEARSTVEW